MTVVEEGVGGRKGLCSGWLNDITSIKYDQEISDQMKNMTLGEQCYHLKIPMYLRIRNAFSVPTDPSVSLIMISAGTGVAPFLGFLKYRADLKINADSIKLGYSWLFYGCRYKKRDFLYRSEIEDFVATGILNKLSVSFSRDFKQNEGDSQNNIKYVQDNIRKEKEQFVHQLLADNNVTFLCGDAKHMAKDVQRCIVCCISEIKGQDEKEAENIFKTLLKNGRYVQDVWL
uniref:Oxidoreductase FAD/NAD(P)-binding domain-containing protein n=2 Tax=Clastoptera arizonana TaxID=38151 RepID=A0A1B6D3S2_9HEMI